MYSILNILYSNGAKSKLYALSQKDIIEALEIEDEKWCDKTVYNKIRLMVNKKYIMEGLKQVNAKTFYITQAGIDWMKEMEGEGEDE